MLAASMSTLSSLVHVGATTLAYDLRGERVPTMRSLQLGSGATAAAIAVWALVLPGGIIAQATAVFFGLAAGAFLPVYVLALRRRPPPAPCGGSPPLRPGLRSGSSGWCSASTRWSPASAWPPSRWSPALCSSWASRLDPAVPAIAAAFVAAWWAGARAPARDGSA